MTHETTFEELNELKAQFALLSEKLQQQKIISEEAIRTNIKERIDYISRKRRQNIIFMIVGYPLLPIPMMLNHDLPIGIYVMYYLIGIAYLFGTWYLHRRLDAPTLASASLIEAGKRVMRYREDIRHWRYVGIPAALVFLVWVWSCLTPDNGASNPQYGQIGMVIGAIIGGIFGLREERKIARKLDEILRQIRNLEQ